jgi:hypothetical protein
VTTYDFRSLRVTGDLGGGYGRLLAAILGNCRRRIRGDGKLLVAEVTLEVMLAGEAVTGTGRHDSDSSSTGVRTPGLNWLSRERRAHAAAAAAVVEARPQPWRLNRPGKPVGVNRCVTCGSVRVNGQRRLSSGRAAASLTDNRLSTQPGQQTNDSGRCCSRRAKSYLNVYVAMRSRDSEGRRQ